MDLRLDGNEGLRPPAPAIEALRQLDPEFVRQYPKRETLEGMLAKRLGRPADELIVTAGGDESIDRLCRAFLDPGREAIAATPTFEMIERYVGLAGAELIEIDWPFGQTYPTDAVIERITPRTSLIFVVTPNNPTGAIATADDLRRLSTAAPQAVIVVDLAYSEFAEIDLTQVVLDLPNAIAIRTLSKAWALAGCRVGYAAGPAEILNALRVAGGPYSVSGPSIAIATACVERESADVAGYIAEVKRERRVLTERLREFDLEAWDSQGNFILARTPKWEWLWKGLAGFGIAVRAFPDRPSLSNCLRITCPGRGDLFDRLMHAIESTLRPDAILFDMDGVIANVGDSYRAAIIETARSFGVDITPADVARMKAAGDANNDWVLTRRLLAERGVRADLDEVTERFESIYQGSDSEPGLRKTERLIPAVEWLDWIASRAPLAIVTGRPRRDAERFLVEAKVDRFFKTVVCMEDGPPKPDPAPLRRAMDHLGLARVWMIGDTPDDMLAARAAGALPIGIAAPHDDSAAVGASLTAAGAGIILSDLTELEEALL